MSTAHTPGPWGYWADGYGDYHIGPLAGGMVAGVFSRNGDDARLITAAPDMLAALEATLAGLEAWVEIADDDDKRDSDNEAIAMARVAIAKAKGTT